MKPRAQQVRAEPVAQSVAERSLELERNVVVREHELDVAALNLR